MKDFWLCSTVKLPDLHTGLQSEGYGNSYEWGACDRTRDGCAGI